MGDSRTAQKEPIRGSMKYTHQHLLRKIEKHNDPREWETHFLLKRIHPGNYEIYTSAAAANNRKHNDPREWQTHKLLKKIHPGNYEKYIISAAAAKKNRNHNYPRR